MGENRKYFDSEVVKEFEAFAKKQGAVYVSVKHGLFSKEIKENRAIFRPPELIWGKGTIAISLSPNGEIRFGYVQEDCDNFRSAGQWYHIDEIDFIIETLKKLKAWKPKSKSLY